MNTNEKLSGLKMQSLPPWYFFDGFVLMEYSSGVQYNLHLSVRKLGKKYPVEYIGNVFLPFNGAGMATYQRRTQLFQKKVHMIINVGVTSSFEDFLNMYRDVCIVRNKLNIHLHIAIFGTSMLVRKLVHDLVVQHPRELITLYDVDGHGVLYSVDYEYVIKNLVDDDLIILMDTNMQFTKEFIWHMKANVVKGYQVYLPMLFSFYNPEVVSHYLHRNPTIDISANTGFFVRYNYQVVGIYKSDYEVAMKHADAGRRTGKDEEQFIDKLVSSNLYVMRALEPHLTRKYFSRKCTSLSGFQRQVCKNSKADAVGSKRMLASLLTSHNLLDT